MKSVDYIKTYVSKLVLKLNTSGAVTISQGKEFQSFIICCEKINRLIVLLF